MARSARDRLMMMAIVAFAGEMLQPVVFMHALLGRPGERGDGRQSHREDDADHCSNEQDTTKNHAGMLSRQGQ